MLLYCLRCHAAAPRARGDVEAAALAAAPEGHVLRAVPAGRGGGAADAAVPVRQVRYARAHVVAADQDVADPAAPQRRVLAGQGHAAGRAPRRRPHPLGVRRGSGRHERHVRRDLGAQRRVRGRRPHCLRPRRRHPAQGQAHVRHGEPRVLLVGPPAARPVHPRVRRHGRGHVGGHLLVRGADARTSGGRPGERAGTAGLRRGGQPRVLLGGPAGAHGAHVLRRLRAAQVAVPAAAQVRERPRRRQARAGATGARRCGAVPVDPVRRERVDESRDQRLEGSGVRLLDQPAAIYAAPGAAQRRLGGAGPVLPPPVLRRQLQAAEALARPATQDKTGRGRGHAGHARGCESQGGRMAGWRGRSAGLQAGPTMDLVSASLSVCKCRGPGIAGDHPCTALDALRSSVVARRHGASERARRRRTWQRRSSDDRKQEVLAHAAMDDEFSTPPRRPHPKRLQRKSESSPEALDQQQRLKREMNLTRELIDFDLIKGSALFHTKPSSHDRKLVQEGLSRALFVPFHAKFWRHKPWFYETATALYALHVAAVCIYIFHHKTTSPHSSFEVFFPVFLLLLVAIGYGRVSSALQAPDTDPACKILSPIIKQATESVCSSESETSHVTSGLGSGLAESENSDGTDSDEDSGNSSSSSDESNLNDDMFPHKSSSAPTSPKRGIRTPIGKPPMSLPPRVPLPLNGGLERDNVADQFARRRVTVCVWEDGFPVKRAMSITELRNTILAKVKATPPRIFYRKVAEVSAITLALVPIALRCTIKCQEIDCLAVTQEPLEVLSWIGQLSRELSVDRLYVHAAELASGASVIAISCVLSTYYMASIVFAALADAEVTYHRRFLYAKCFTALTSSRRSRLANLPHFRLKNVVNIKAWISLRGGRTWLKRQGRQRAADEIVSSSFLVILVLLVVMGMQAVSDGPGSLSAESIIHIEVAIWCMLSSVFMLRFMMLGSNINKKYQSTSLLLTEQMNVYLRLLAKPHKKEKLLVSNNVLKLACKLLKELNSPNKVSGLTMNPLLYNLTRVVVLSAFSSTASDFFGFKLKLWKLKA